MAAFRTFLQNSCVSGDSAAPESNNFHLIIIISTKTGDLFAKYSGKRERSYCIACTSSRHESHAPSNHGLDLFKDEGVDDGTVKSPVVPLEFVVVKEFEDGALCGSTLLHFLLHPLVNPVQDEWNDRHGRGLEDGRVSFVPSLDLSRGVRHRKGGGVADRNSGREEEAFAHQLQNVCKWEVCNVDVY